MKKKQMFRTVLLAMLIEALLLPASSEAVILDAETCEGFFASPGGGSEYLIILVITNNHPVDFSYDEIEAMFIPNHGTPLVLRVTKGDKDDKRRETNQTSKVFVQKRGESQTYQFETDGYTYNLLSDARGSPLQFVISIKRNGRTIEGPYGASLPPINKLPDCIETKSGKVKRIKLIFEKGEFRER